MGNLNVVQSTFSWGELDPRLYAQANFDGYQKGLKDATNCLGIPQGGMMRRWGTKYIATATATNPVFADIYGFVYDEKTKYCLLFEGLLITIYFQDIQVATVVTTYPAEEIANIFHLPIQNRLILLNGKFAPRQLVRSANAANIITGVDTVLNYITVTTALTPGQVLPITFTTGGTLPLSNPQIYTGTNYFARVINANNIRVFSTADDASNNVNFFDITATGTGNVLVQNTWVISDIPFSNLPAYDFDKFATYSATGFTFQASATSGTLAAPSTITASGAVFTAAHVGGLITGNAGIGRIIAFTDTTHVNVITVVPFATTGAFPGNTSFLGEPAWSAARGYPITGDYHQERLWLAGTGQIPGGLWGSIIYELYNFDGAEELQDDSIADYSAKTPIKYITSAKTLIVHTVTGNYSTQLTDNVPLTPTLFSLTQQTADGISSVRPVFIDNQIIYVDQYGRNIKNMAWDISQSSFINTTLSVASAHLIDNPVDMATFVEPHYTDGLFVFVVNSDGTLAIFQTLQEQNMRSWTHATTKQSLTDGEFCKVTSALDKCWFLIKRLIPTAQAPVAITAFAGTPANTLTATAHGLTIGEGCLVKFTTTGVLPATTPALNVNDYFWARGVTVDTFKVYSSQLNADADTNAFVVTSAGTTSNLVRWPSIARLYIESLDYSVYTDSTTKFTAVGGNTLTGLQHLNGETVQIVADGFVLQPQVVPSSGALTLPQAATTAQVGLQYISTVSPLPLSIVAATGPNFYVTKHIRNLNIHYYNMYGATLQGFTIPVQNMQDIVLDVPPIPQSGIYSYPLMEGWDGFEFDIMISQALPLPMTILGIGYVVEVV